MKVTRRTFIGGLIAAGVASFTKPTAPVVNLLTPKQQAMLTLDQIFAAQREEIMKHLEAQFYQSSPLWELLQRGKHNENV